jgi:hypothetical protein
MEGRDRLGIAIVVLVTLEERFHVLGRDQTHVVTKRRQLGADRMRARAGLHTDQAARDIGETAFELPRDTFCCRPRLSNPTKWNVFLPRSTPIVAIGSSVL